MKALLISLLILTGIPAHAASIILNGELQAAPDGNNAGIDYLLLLRVGTDEVIAGLIDPSGDLRGFEGTNHRTYGQRTGTSFDNDLPVVNVERCGVASYAFPSGAQQLGGPAAFTGESNLISNDDTEDILDHDGDGMLTDYELENDLDPALDDSMEEDADNDNYINLHEAHAGTNANDPTSLLRIDNIEINGHGDVRVTWQSVPDMQYRVAGRPLPGTAIDGSRIVLSAGAQTSATFLDPAIDIQLINIEVQP
jgi:hypothetical protein